MKLITKPVTLILLACSLLWISAAQADTSITYQGRLDSGGSPYSGTVGMDIRLFAESSGGSPLAEQTGNSVQVVDGLFQVALDFGDQMYADGRWLDITVNGQALSPRQKVTGAPFAVRALNADHADQATIPQGSISHNMLSQSMRPRYAWVSASGDLSSPNSRNAVSASRVGLGQYEVSFDTWTTFCARVGGLGSVTNNWGGVARGFVLTARAPTGDHAGGVAVRTFNEDGEPADRGFWLMLMC